MDIIDQLQLQEENIPSRSVRPFMPGIMGTQKIQNGIVYCLECNMEIPSERIKALPYATLCCSCAEQQELAQRQLS